MGIKDIEPVAYQLVAYDAEDIQGVGCIDYAIDEITREPFTDSDMNRHGLTQWDFCECIPLYTEEQLQEYARVKVREALTCEFIPVSSNIELIIEKIFKEKQDEEV